MANSNGKVFMMSAVAGLLALGAAGAANPAAAGEGDKVKCYGANKCKGQGECGGKGYSCAGKNACKGQGWIHTENEEACLKLEGGRLTAEEPAE